MFDLVLIHHISNQECWLLQEGNCRVFYCTIKLKCFKLNESWRTKTFDLKLEIYVCSLNLFTIAIAYSFTIGKTITSSEWLVLYFIWGWGRYYSFMGIGSSTSTSNAERERNSKKSSHCSECTECSALCMADPHWNWYCL